MSKLDKQLYRNLKGIEYEKYDELNKAIDLYEKNISESFEGNHPYDRLAIIYRKHDRLAIIYRKHGRLDDEVRVLEKAVYVFENLVYKNRLDRIPKLEKFIKRLEKVNKLKLNRCE